MAGSEGATGPSPGSKTRTQTARHRHHSTPPTGLRVEELCNLRLEDVELSERKGKVIVRQGKGEKWQEVPLNRDARAAAVAVHFHPVGKDDFPRRSVRRQKIWRTGGPRTVHSSHPSPHILSRVGGQGDSPRRDRDAGWPHDSRRAAQHRDDFHLHHAGGSGSAPGGRSALGSMTSPNISLSEAF